MMMLDDEDVCFTLRETDSLKYTLRDQQSTVRERETHTHTHTHTH